MQACYARQSIDKKDSISIETQIELAKKECIPEEDIEEYKDKGYSGKNTKRPEWQRMMRDVQEGKISRIIVYRIDRFSRSLLDFSNAWEIMKDHNVDFISVNEKFDTSTPIGKAMLFILMVFAQLERETIAERVADNYYARTKLGNWPGGPAPYGFQNGRIEIAGKKRPTLIENDLMEHVHTIFELYATGNYSLGSLAKYLDDNGISGIQRSNWCNVSLARLMKNPAYVKADADVYAYYKAMGVNVTNPLEDFDGEHGGMLIGKRERGTVRLKPKEETVFNLGNWEGVISSEIWLACQKKLAKNKQIKTSGIGKKTWLSGMLKCASCGRSVRVLVNSSVKSKIKYLNCTGHVERCCDMLFTIRGNDVEEIVAEELKRILKQCVDEPLPAEKKGLSAREKIELQEIEEKIQNLINGIAGGNAAAVTMKYINAEITRMEERRAVLAEAALEAAASVTKPVVCDHVEFDRLDLEEKKMVARAYIDHIKVGQNQIEIVWKV